MSIANLKKHLLGDYSPIEAESIDLQIISGEISEENLLWAESELTEDYLDDALTPEETALFEKNFLVSPERIAQFKQISLVKNYARNAAAKSVSESVRETEPENLFVKLKNFFSMNRRPAIAVFSLLIIGLFVGFYLTASRQTNAEKEFSALNQSDLSDLAKLQSLSSLSLTSGAFRNSGDVRKLTQSRLAERVFFRLALPARYNAADKFEAELVKNGKVVFTQSKLPVYNNPNGQEIRLLLPSAELMKGTYQIKLTGEAAPDSPLIYNFGIE